MKSCQVNGCLRKFTAKGFCATHYAQFKRYGKVTLRPSESPCTQCNEIFVHKLNGPIRKICPECFKQNESIRIKNYSREYHKNNGLKKVYGITIDDYVRMKQEQNFKCAICGDEADGQGAKFRNLCVDHNHTTGKIRGLLCTKCNSGLGHFRDSIPNLMNAITYLETRN